MDFLVKVDEDKEFGKLILFGIPDDDFEEKFDYNFEDDLV